MRFFLASLSFFCWIFPSTPLPTPYGTVYAVVERRLKVIATADNSVFDMTTLPEGDEQTLYMADTGTLHALSATNSASTTQNSTPATVTLINTLTNGVAATLSLPPGGAHNGGLRMAFSPDGTKGYIACPEAQAISVLDIGANQILHTINTPGFSPYNIIASPDGQKIYTASVTANVQVYDANSYSLLSTISTDGAGAYGLALTADSKTLYIGADSTTCYEVDTSSYAKTSLVAPSGGRRFCALSKNEKHVYFGGTTNTLCIYDRIAQTFSSVFTADPCYFVQMSPDGTHFFGVPGESAREFSHIYPVRVSSPTTKSHSINGAQYLYGMDITANGHYAYFTPNNLPYLTRYQPDTEELVNISLGEASGGCSAVAIANYVGVQGSRTKVNAGIAYAFYDTLIWEEPPIHPTQYQIYYDRALTQLVGTVDGGQRTFTNTNLVSQGPIAYWVVATYANGVRAIVTTVTIS